jgi:hypothetical protein
MFKIRRTNDQNSSTKTSSYSLEKAKEHGSRVYRVKPNGKIESRHSTLIIGMPDCFSGYFPEIGVFDK